MLEILIRQGTDLDPIALPGFTFPLPAKYAVVGFFLIAEVSGWFGWFLLRQAQKIMHRLEFELGAHPDEIKATLAGSSFISASVILVQLLCCTTVALSSHAILYSLSISLNLAAEAESRELALLFMFLFFTADVPFLLIASSFRFRYFQPSKWIPGKLFIFLNRYFLLTDINPTYEILRQKNAKERAGTNFNNLLTGDQIAAFAEISSEDVTEINKLSISIKKFVPHAFGAVFSKQLRQYGNWKFLHCLFKNDLILRSEAWALIENRTAELLREAIPNAKPDTYEKIRSHIEYQVELYYSDALYMRWILDFFDLLINIRSYRSS